MLAVGMTGLAIATFLFGLSTTFFMAMLAGLKGVRSAVASQIATEIRAPLATHLKTGLHLPSFLNALGIKTLTAYVDNHEALLAKVYAGLDVGSGMGL